MNTYNTYTEYRVGLHVNIPYMSHLVHTVYAYMLHILEM